MRTLPDRVLELAGRQAGILARRQLVPALATDNDVRSWLLHRLLVRVHPGVYVVHTGELAWLSRAWAGVLVMAPAALCGESALRAGDGPGRRGHEHGEIHVAVEAGRSLDPPVGVRLHRVRGLATRTQWNLSPPRVRVEEAVLDVAAAAADDFTAVAVVADAVSSRRTTAGRLSAALDARSRIARRAFLRDVLADVAAGACSVLERCYLRDVERAHGLPTAGRQVRASARGPAYRDVHYRAQALVVELDGRLDHTRVSDRDRDLDRDLLAAVDALATVRLGWGQAVGRPCWTAAQVARLLARRGWSGSPRSCPRCASSWGIAARGAQRSPTFP